MYSLVSKWRSLTVGITFIGIAFSANAQLPSARLWSVFPLGGSPGNSLEVKVRGTDLEVGYGLFFSHPGITAEAIYLPDNPFRKKNAPVPNQFLVHIDSSVPEGRYEIRAFGALGISNPRLFMVSRLPRQADVKAGENFESAGILTIDSLGDAVAEKLKIHHYRFDAKKGDRLIIQCWAERIDSKMDATLILADSNEREMMRSDNVNGLDPLIDFTVPISDSYCLKVFDTLFQGGEDYFYRISIHSGPYVDFIYPPGPTESQAVQSHLFGRNLNGSKRTEWISRYGKKLEKAPTPIGFPQQSNGSIIRYAVNQAGLPFLDPILPAPNQRTEKALWMNLNKRIQLESEPNDKPTEATAVRVPIELSGRFYPAGDVDWITFHSTKKETLWLEVFSERFGHATDPILIIQKTKKDENGQWKVIEEKTADDTKHAQGGSTFPCSSRDPLISITTDPNTHYRVQVRDQLNSTYPDPSLIYHLSIRHPQPDFTLLTVVESSEQEGKQANVWSPLLRQRGTVALKVIAFRKDGFKGSIALTVEGLPSTIKSLPVWIPSGQDSVRLILEVLPDAARWQGAIRIIGTANINGEERTRVSDQASQVWNTGDYSQSPVTARLNSNLCIGISEYERSPVHFNLSGESPIHASIGEELVIPIKIERNGDFKGPVSITSVDFPGLKNPPVLSLDNDSNEGSLTLNLAQKDGNKFHAGTIQFYLKASGTAKHKKLEHRLESLRTERSRLEQVILKLKKTNDTPPHDPTTEDTRKSAEKELERIENELKKNEEWAQPKDLKFVIFSSPITVNLIEKSSE